MRRKSEDPKSPRFIPKEEKEFSVVRRKSEDPEKLKLNRGEERK